jgi:hypothetical protein
MSHAKSGLFDIIAPRSKFYQGPFGRLCSNLPAWTPAGFDPDRDAEAITQHFMDIANSEMIEAPGKTPEEIAQDNELIEQLENEFGSTIPAGYTYFGQFIDHDITFDPASSLMRRNDPNGLLNHRTPRLDLDNIYGQGRDQSPYLYDSEDRDKFLIGQVKDSNLRDLPRNSQGRALIGDMRNDENSMVSQLQLAFLLAHNTLIDRARDAGLDNPFEQAQKTLRWLYQYIVWNDFLTRITQKDVHKCAMCLDKVCGKGKQWQLGLDYIYKWKYQPFMPVEFSVAAYRFGHSMVRNSYQTNQPHRGFGNFAPIFDNTDATVPDDLRGFRPMLKENVIQWDWFLEMTTSRGPFPQRARKIDTKLSNALSFLHEDEAGSPMNVLAFRNLLRGWRFELPSGSAVARKFCLDPIEIDGEHDALWFYILKEAESQPGNKAGQSLGQLGSMIVCATFAGLLQGDPNSWVNVEPCWTPDKDPLLTEDDNQDPGDWTLASIIRLSGLPVDGNDVSNQS